MLLPFSNLRAVPDFPPPPWLFSPNPHSHLLFINTTCPKITQTLFLPSSHISYTVTFVTKIKEIMSPQTSTWKHKFNWKYQDLFAENTGSDEEQSSPCLEKGLPSQHPSPRPWSKLLTFLPWFLTTILLIATVIQSTHSHEKCLVPESGPIGSFPHGFASDFCRYPPSS